MIRYSELTGSYTALSTDDLTSLEATLTVASHEVELYITDTGEHLIFDSTIDSFVPISGYGTSYAIGSLGGKAITGTSAVTPDTGYYFYAIQVMADIVVSAQGNVSGHTNPTLSALIGGVPAGTVIYGKFTSITLTSGEAIGYYAKV